MNACKPIHHEKNQNQRLIEIQWPNLLQHDKTKEISALKLKCEDPRQENQKPRFSPYQTLCERIIKTKSN